MLSYETMVEKLRSSLSPKRFIHTLHVVDTALELADFYHEDREKTKIAALLHDCAKDYPYLLKVQLCKEFHIVLDPITQKNPELIHSFLGAEIAKREYKVEDGYILNSIRYHTTGRANMTLLEKIVFLADYMEPTRLLFPGLEEVRALAYVHLDKAIYQALLLTIAYIKEQGFLLHPLTQEAVDDLKAKFL
ncbi:MAG: HD domain-containing protein [Epulopiscium sp.]|nr:HD domain-containing protein [Candidatus Epulonipiscium sp.]